MALQPGRPSAALLLLAVAVAFLCGLDRVSADGNLTASATDIQVTTYGDTPTSTTFSLINDGDANVGVSQIVVTGSGQPSGWLTLNRVAPLVVLKNSVPMNILVTIAPAALTAGTHWNVISFTHSSSVTTVDVNVTITIEAGFVVTYSPAAVSGIIHVAEGGTVQVSAHIRSKTTAAIHIVPSVIASGTNLIANGTITLQSNNALSTVRSTTIYVPDDVMLEDTRIVNLSYAVTSANAAYDGLAIASATVNVADNDQVGIMFDPSLDSLSVYEDGNETMFQVRLASQPQADVTIDLDTAYNDTVTITPSSVTFTTLNWNSWQQVTLAGVQNEFTSGYRTLVTPDNATGVTSDDPYYAALVVPGYTFTLIDDDVAYTSITPAYGSNDGGTVVTITLPSTATLVDDEGALPSVSCQFSLLDGSDYSDYGTARILTARAVQCTTPSCITAFFAERPFIRCVSVEKLVLVVNNQTSYNNSDFHFLSAPVISKVEPTSGPVGQAVTVTVHGTGFTDTSLALCKFGQMRVPATAVTIDGEVVLICTAPKRADYVASKDSHSVTVEVSLDGQSFTSGSEVTYTYDHANTKSSRVWLVFYLVFNAIILLAIALCLRDCFKKRGVIQVKKEVKKEEEATGPRALLAAISEEMVKLQGLDERTPILDPEQPSEIVVKKMSIVEEFDPDVTRSARRSVVTHADNDNPTGSLWSRMSTQRRSFREDTPLVASESKQSTDIATDSEDVISPRAVAKKKKPARTAKSRRPKNGKAGQPSFGSKGLTELSAVPGAN